MEHWQCSCRVQARVHPGSPSKYNRQLHSENNFNQDPGQYMYTTDTIEQDYSTNNQGQFNQDFIRRLFKRHIKTDGCEIIYFNIGYIDRIKI